MINDERPPEITPETRLRRLTVHVLLPGSSAPSADARHRAGLSLLSDRAAADYLPPRSSGERLFRNSTNALPGAPFLSAPPS
jgi:hypothetical protein